MSERAARVEYAESARDDLGDIIEWYSSQQVPHVGVRLVGEILARAEQLAEFPDSGKVVLEFDSAWLREIIHPPFRIIYRRDNDLVTVVRVWRSERLMDSRLGDNAEPAD